MSTSLMEHIARSMRAVRAEYDVSRERALDTLERDFGISRDRVAENGDLEVAPEEFDRLISTAVSSHYDPVPAHHFRLNLIVVRRRSEFLLI